MKRFKEKRWDVYSEIVLQFISTSNAVPLGSDNTTAERPFFWYD
ncbi:MAG: hypothetical protein QF856_06095 [Candidatus Marinimicrobia bacterium]|nr:hypothetical protein [Candidatus Neomarinimicrobiota bacterium]